MRTSILLTSVTTVIAMIGCRSDCHNTRQCGCDTGCAAQPAAPEPVGKVHVSDPPCVNKPPCAGKSDTAPPVMPDAPDAPTESKPVPAQIPKQVIFKPATGSKFGHAKDFSWLMGQLRRVHVNGGSWKIRYKPIDEQDRWGGSVVLSEDVRIDQFEDGDFVYVTGEIIRKRPTVYLAGPLYRLNSIRKMTEADRERTAARRLQGTSIRK